MEVYKMTKLCKNVLKSKITGIRGVGVMLSFTTTFRYFSQKSSLGEASTAGRIDISNPK